MVLRHQLILAQNGWPSVTYQGVEPNNAAAVANVQNEQVGQIDEICNARGAPHLPISRGERRKW